jgi:hypothetical protein
MWMRLTATGVALLAAGSMLEGGETGRGRDSRALAAACRTGGCLRIEQHAVHTRQGR